MIILGISYLSDSGACIVNNGKIISAANEERFNRTKLFYGIPELSIAYVLNEAGLDIGNIDCITTHGYCVNEDGIEFINDGLVEEEKLRDVAINKVKEKINNSSLSSELKNIKNKDVDDRYQHENNVIYNRNINTIRLLKKFKKPIKVVEHHMSHAAGAYFCSGWDDCFVLTADGWGEMESNILCKASAGKLSKLNYSHSFDSLGYFYGSITKALGFIPHRHEGKVLGLAAYGNPNDELHWIEDMISYDPINKRFEGRFDNGIYRANFDNQILMERLKNYKREDIAFVVQRTLEKVVCEYISDNIHPVSRVALAGGIFANVLLNQKILKMPNISDVFVFPHMGDGGLSVGSALHYFSRTNNLKSTFIKSLYLGPEFDADQIVREIESFGFKFSYYDKIEEEIAKLLSSGNVIMRFSGKMEYGPRALGNRSILYQTTDKTVNDWLNKSLHRSEFMPFAPVTLKSEAERCYRGIKNHIDSALHMTITFDCTDWMKKTSPGVVHVDGTARPQLVDKDLNDSLYKILVHYYNLTGIPSIINTSFNMHEEPIVCTPSDALRAYKDSKLKYLSMGNYLITN